MFIPLAPAVDRLRASMKAARCAWVQNLLVLILVLPATASLFCRRSLMHTWCLVTFRALRCSVASSSSMKCEHGQDPREFTLIPFGGAGGLHAITLARALQIPRVLLPASPGALSAIGVVTADVVKDQSRTLMLEASRGVAPKLEQVFGDLEKQAHAILRREGLEDSKQRHERSLAARYQGQSFELHIKQTRGDIAAAFHRAHRARYGYAQEKNVVEIVSARLRSIGVVEKLKTRRFSGSSSDRFVKPHDFSETYFEQKRV